MGKAVEVIMEGWVEGKRQAGAEKQAAAEASAEEAARSAAANRIRKLKEVAGPKLGAAKKTNPPPRP